MIKKGSECIVTPWDSDCNFKDGTVVRVIGFSEWSAWGFPQLYLCTDGKTEGYCLIKELQEILKSS